MNKQTKIHKRITRDVSLLEIIIKSVIDPLCVFLKCGWIYK